MQIADYMKSLGEMSEEEIMELIQTTRRNRQTVTQSKVKAIKKQAAKKNVKAAIANLTETEREELIRKIKEQLNA